MVLRKILEFLLGTAIHGLPLRHLYDSKKTITEFCTESIVATSTHRTAIVATMKDFLQNAVIAYIIFFFFRSNHREADTTFLRSSSVTQTVTISPTATTSLGCFTKPFSLSKYAQGRLVSHRYRRMHRSPLRYERFLRVPFLLVGLPSSRHRYVRLVLRLLHVGRPGFNNPSSTNSSVSCPMPNSSFNSFSIQSFKSFFQLW